MKLSVVSAKLGDPGVASVILGQSPPSSTYNGIGKGLPFFQGKVDFQRLHPIPRVWCTDNRKFAHPGDILISVRAPVGDVNVATDHCGIGRGLAAVRPGPDSDPWFLYFALLYSKPTLETMATGSTFASVNRSTLNNLDIPFFDKLTQTAIGRFLFSLVRKIEQEDQVLHTTQALKRAAMRALLTRGLRGEAQKETEIGLLPQSWEAIPVAAVAGVKGGKRMPKGIALTSTDTGQPYIRVTDFRDHGVDANHVLFVPKGYESTLSRYIISTDDVYISIAGTIGLVGQVSQVLDGANLTENAAKISVTDQSVDARFLMYSLASDACQLQIAQSTATNAQPKLALVRIEQIQLPIPPTLDEQYEVVAILDAIDRKIDLHRRKRTMLDELYKALLHKLMTGEIRMGELAASVVSQSQSPSTRRINRGTRCSATGGCQ